MLQIINKTQFKNLKAFTMKAYIKMITGLLFIAAMAMFITGFTGCSFIVPFTVLVIASMFIKTPANALHMGLAKEVWQTDIVDNLFKDNQFAEMAFNADGYVLGGAVVHVPNAGAPLGSKKNATAFPIQGVQRTDADVVYPIDKYFAPPIFVQNVEQAELAYDKRQSVAGEQQAQLIQDAMDGLLYNWSWKTTLAIGANNNASNYVLTTGDTTATDIVSGATGTRKVFTKAVFSQIVKNMNAANIPAAGRVALLTAFHHQQFLDTLSDAERTNFNAFADMSKGVVGEYLGFKFMMRSTVQYWRKTGLVWAPVDTQADAFAASDKSNDSAASLIYQVSCVERARGDVNVFDNAGRAEYYGDLMSADLRFGGRQRRNAGVYAVIEDIAA